MVSSAVLSDGQEQVDVVAAHEILGHAYDSAAQGDLAVVVGRVLCDVTTELGYLDLTLELSLETGEQYFTLAWFEAVAETGDGASAICDRELN